MNNIKMSILGVTDFGKLKDGDEFYLVNPHVTGSPAGMTLTKMPSRKTPQGKWNNAKTSYGAFTFVQYDKKVWVK